MTQTDMSTLAIVGRQPSTAPAPVEDTQIEAPGVSGATVLVDINSLRITGSPRLEGIDPQHVQTLAEIDTPLPPILVHRQTMWLIDGMHRLAAARINGRTAIRAVLFDGSREEAFQLAVKANVTHGLPLSQSDRQAAAARIILADPEMSDRSIAATVGLAARTVATIRRQAAGSEQVTHRVGKDGRVRPLNTAEGRRLAGAMIVSQPTASLRKIAEQAGVSVGTVRDVRARIKAGEDPVPDRIRQIGSGGEAVSQHPKRSAPVPEPEADLDELLAALRRDPALRYTESGRTLLRWLGSKTFPNGQWRDIVEDIPPHSAIMVARLARGCAADWTKLAQELDTAISICVAE